MEHMGVDGEKGRREERAVISNDKTLIANVRFPISPVIYPSKSAVSESHHYKTNHHYNDDKTKSDQLNYSSSLPTTNQLFFFPSAFLYFDTQAVGKKSTILMVPYILHVHQISLLVRQTLKCTRRDK